MKYDIDRINRRHLLGFRRFQNAALRALSSTVSALKPDSTAKQKESAPVKIGDMKSLVSAYKDAVVGERMVLGMESSRSAGDWPEEMIVRWVEDEEEQPSKDGAIGIS